MDLKVSNGLAPSGAGPQRIVRTSRAERGGPVGRHGPSATSLVLLDRASYPPERLISQEPDPNPRLSARNMN